MVNIIDTCHIVFEKKGATHVSDTDPRLESGKYGRYVAPARG
jgi:hypothetical protein